MSTFASLLTTETISLPPMLPTHTEMPQKTSRVLLTITQCECRDERSIVFYWRVLMQKPTGCGSCWAIRSCHRESTILVRASPLLLYKKKWWFIHNWSNVISVLWLQFWKSQAACIFSLGNNSFFKISGCGGGMSVWLFLYWVLWDRTALYPP